MVRTREARRAHKRFHGRCFWSYAPGLEIGPADVDWLARSAASGGSRGAGDRTVAVVPLENLSTDPDNAFFAIGVQDEILTQLEKISDLHVISRSSTMRYPAGPARAAMRTMGRELGARWIVEGSVARIYQEVRINLQLIESATDAHVWAEVYDGDLTVQGLLAFQAQVARRVAASLKATIQPEEASRIASIPTDDVKPTTSTSAASTPSAVGARRTCVVPSNFSEARSPSTPATRSPTPVGRTRMPSSPSTRRSRRR